jgi:hypothetical protein
MKFISAIYVCWCIFLILFIFPNTGCKKEEITTCPIGHTYIQSGKVIDVRQSPDGSGYIIQLDNGFQIPFMQKIKIGKKLIVNECVSNVFKKW